MGIVAVVTSSFLSGFAGVYFEKILKHGDASIWLRNLQLAVFSLFAGIAGVFFTDRKEVIEKGFFFGYTSVVILMVAMQACGGLLVAVVIKYTDNITKGFATSLSVILSALASVPIFGFHLTPEFIFAALLVVIAVYLYNAYPSKQTKENTDETINPDESNWTDP